MHGTSVQLRTMHRMSVQIKSIKRASTHRASYLPLHFLSFLLTALFTVGSTQFTGQIQHTLCIGVRNTLNCPAGTRFFVLSQTYGWKVAPDRTGCRVDAADYQYVLTLEDMHNGINPLISCSGKKTCEVTVRNWWQHAHGDADYLVVTYICDPVKICYLSHPETHSIYYPRSRLPVSLTECCCVDTGYSYTWGRDSPCADPNVPQEIADDMCPFGYGRKKDGSDIDECVEHSQLCLPGGSCVNQPGSYYCGCDPGWRVNQDWKGCSLPQSHTTCERYPNICGPGGSCVPSTTGFSCNCRSPGYKTTAYGTCLDVDECHENSRLCSPHGECVNTIGAFRCHCKDGFHQRGNECVDVDECQLHPTLCDDGKMYGSCVNTPGSYRCSCNAGYHLDMQGGEVGPNDRQLSPIHFQCVDVNECSEDDGICGWATCVNLEGSYRCDCGEGYEIQKHDNGTVCDDVDECDRNPNICGGGNCTNIHGSYLCSCHLGFMHTYSTLHTILKRPICSDINECEMDASTCKSGETCINTEGSFVCECEEDPSEDESKGKQSKCGSGPAVEGGGTGDGDGKVEVDGDGDNVIKASSNGTTGSPVSGSGKAEHSISFGPVVSESDPNTIMVIAVILPIVLICLLLLALFFLYKRRKIFSSSSPGAVLFRLPSRVVTSSSTLDYTQNHVNQTYNHARVNGEGVVLLPNSPSNSAHADTVANSGALSQVTSAPPPNAPPAASSPFISANPDPTVSLPLSRSSSSSLQHRQSWTPRRPNYEPPPPPTKGAADSSRGVTPPHRGFSLARSQSMKEATPTKTDDGNSGDVQKLTVALGPGSKKRAPFTPTRLAPAEPGYESVAPFQKTSIEGNDYYVGGSQSEHVYEEPVWPIKGGKADKQQELKELKEEEEEEVGAVGGVSLASTASRGYNKPIHPGSKHISSEQLNRLCNAYDDDDNDNGGDNDDDVNDNNDDDDDVGYSRPLLQGSRSQLYDDTADDEDDESHNYDEPYVESPHLPTKDAVDRL